MSCRHTKAFTLLELMIVAVLMAMVAVMTGQMWRVFSAQSADLTQRTTAAMELRLAIESLRDDFGSVQWATPVTDSRLVVAQESSSPSAPNLVEYKLDGAHRLVRTDQATGTSIPIADCVEDFEVRDIDESTLQIALRICVGQTSRLAKLIWSRPS